MPAVFGARHVPTFIAMIVMVIAMIFAEHQNREVFEQSQRNDVLRQVAIIRAQLEGKIAANIQLVHGMVSAISTEPEMDHHRFSELAAYLLGQENQLRSVTAAPDMIVRFVYPIEGNEAVFGLDQAAPRGQQNAASLARDTRRTVMTPPVDLVQGGQGFIGRFPVFYLDNSGQEQFWGLVSAVIDIRSLYQASGLLDAQDDISFSLSSIDPADGSVSLFFGDPAISLNDPVKSEIEFTAGKWLMNATPKQGWGGDPPNTVKLRIIMAFAAGLVLLPIILAGLLSAEKRRRIAEQQKRQDELARISHRLELALAASQVGVWEYNIATGHMSWDDRMSELFGMPDDDRPQDYAFWRERVHPDDVERMERDLRTAIRTGTRYSSTFRILASGHNVKHIRAIGSLSHDSDSPTRVIGVSWDVTADALQHDALVRAKTEAEARNFELETAKASIEHSALHDPLTGLPNRRYLDDVLKLSAVRTALKGDTLSILHIDLDRFKQINDTMGHAAGDAMLIHAAEILKASIRQSDFVARIGGDEFVILCLETVPANHLQNLSDRIIEAMRRPVSYQGHECRFGVSIGIAESDGHQISPSQLLINADIALYRAKRRGRNRWEFFSEELQAEIIHTKQLSDDILSALDNAEFVAHFQPQFSADTLDIVGLEALARWHHPFRGVITPDVFLAAAEDLGVMADIDRLVLEQSVSCLNMLRKAGLQPPRISVNVSAKRLHDEGLIETLRALDITPGTISFELAESVLLDEANGIVNWNIDQLRELGIDIEIDDFGTGHSSILSLLYLRPKRLKIDRKLVGLIPNSTQQRSLVKSIVDIAQSLGIETVAEGVETDEQSVILSDMGCTTLQGYAYARPMQTTEIEAFLKSRIRIAS